MVFANKPETEERNQTLCVRNNRKVTLISCAKGRHHKRSSNRRLDVRLVGLPMEAESQTDLITLYIRLSLLAQYWTILRAVTLTCSNYG